MDEQSQSDEKILAEEKRPTIRELVYRGAIAGTASGFLTMLMSFSIIATGSTDDVQAFCIFPVCFLLPSAISGLIGGIVVGKFMARRGREESLRGATIGGASAGLIIGVSIILLFG